MRTATTKRESRILPIRIDSLEVGGGVRSAVWEMAPLGHFVVLERGEGSIVRIR